MRDAGARAFRRRHFTNSVMIGFTTGCTVVVLASLALILGFLARTGISAINLDFFTHLPKPVGEVGGGMANAIVGTVVLLALACVAGIPVGVFGGIFLAEFRDSPLTGWVRFFADVLSGTPSIVIGMFAYTLVVVPMRSFSALAGGVALSIIMIPIVLRTTEELVRLVPISLREGALALGIPQWRVTLRVVLPAAWAGVLTGILLATARIAGETAPLLFTAFGNHFWSLSVVKPIAALPLQIFAYAIAPYDDWHRQAWAGALVLVVLVLTLNILARRFSRRAMST